MTYPGQQPQYPPSGQPQSSAGGYPPASYPQSYPQDAGYPHGAGYPQGAVPLAGYAVQGAYGQPAGYQYARAPVPTAPDGQPLAGFGDRLLAWLIDTAIMTGVALVLIIPAVIAQIALTASLIEDTQFDADGNVINEPDVATVILPIFLIYGVMFLLLMAAYYVYHVELMYKRGSTVGKRVMKLKVVPIDQPSAPLTRGMAVKRWAITYLVGWVIPFFNYLDGLWQLWDKPYLQCLHDKWARTVVVKVGS